MSGFCLAYLSTAVVGRTARFCNPASRLMMASAIPVPQKSLPSPVISRKGSTAMLWTLEAEAVSGGAGGVGAVFRDEDQYPMAIVEKTTMAATVMSLE